MIAVKRHALSLDTWPGVDQAAWQALVRPGDMFEDDGAGAAWRPATARNLTQCYGHWLSFITEALPILMDQAPADRTKPEHLTAWIDSMEDLLPSTRYLRVQGMARVLKAFPGSNDRDWTWLDRIVRRLRLRAGQHISDRKQGRVIPSDELLETGLTAFEAALASAKLTPVTQAIKARDGLMVAMLATRPVRVSNFAALEIGRTLLKTADGFHIDLPEVETKTGQPFEMPIPNVLTDPLRIWIDALRPRLLARSRTVTSRLWIGREGRPMNDKIMAARISTVTTRLMGVDICPHLFRDALATTIARQAPETTQSIKALLGHSTLATAERHYNQAKGTEASQALADLIDKRRKQHAGIGQVRGKR